MQRLPAYSREEKAYLAEWVSRWRNIARPDQIPPDDGSWFVYLLLSGRGSGKTRAGAEWVLKRVRDGYRYIALIGETAQDVRDTMVETGPSSIMKIARPHERPIYEPSKRRLIFPSGAVAQTFSGVEPDQLRGPQFDTAWVDELAKYKYPQETWDNLEFALRLGKRPQCVVTTTPRPIPLIKELIADPMVIRVSMSTMANAENLPERYMRRILKKYGGTRLGRQEINGEVLEDTPGALWTHDVLDMTRVPHYDGVFSKVVVAVDPAVTSGENAADTGITVSGIGALGHGYVIADYSMHARPLDWATKAIEAYYLHGANYIVGEANNGGELIETVVHLIDPNVVYKDVYASRGKLTRAEPVAMLYEQGRVHHIGSYPDLEDQLTSWVPGEKSPDRLDSLVWGLTSLMITKRFKDPDRFNNIMTA